MINKSKGEEVFTSKDEEVKKQQHSNQNLTIYLQELRIRGLWGLTDTEVLASQVIACYVSHKTQLV